MTSIAKLQWHCQNCRRLFNPILLRPAQFRVVVANNSSISNVNYFYDHDEDGGGNKNSNYDASFPRINDTNIMTAVKKISQTRSSLSSSVTTSSSLDFPIIITTTMPNASHYFPSVCCCANNNIISGAKVKTCFARFYHGSACSAATGEQQPVVGRRNSSTTSSSSSDTTSTKTVFIENKVEEAYNSSNKKYDNDTSEPPSERPTRWSNWTGKNSWKGGLAFLGVIIFGFGGYIIRFWGRSTNLYIKSTTETNCYLDNHCFIVLLY